MHVAIERNSWRIPQDDVVQVARPRGNKKDQEELAYVGLTDGQYWRSIIFSLLAIALVIGGITSAILWYGFVDNLLYWSGQRITLETYLRGDLSPERLPPSWVSSNHLVFQADDESLSLFNFIDKSVSLLVPNHTLKELDVKGYKCSTDLKYILLKHHTKKVSKNTLIAQYTVFNVSDNHQVHLKISAKDFELQSADWAGVTNKLIMVGNNNIYIRHSVLDEDRHVQITDDGIPDVIYNGIPDWLYQEEILKDTEQTFWSSADGSHLMYATFNDSLVQNLEYPWLAPHNLQNTNNPTKFPTTRFVRYPTPGTENPTVRLWIVNIQSINQSDKIEIMPHPTIAEQDYYFTSANWINESNSQVYVVWMNRVQNTTLVSYCEAPSWNCSEIHTEAASENMWLDIQPPPVFSPNGDSFLFLAPTQESGKRYFTQIKHITVENKHVATISHGRYEVMRIASWDTLNNLIYYEGTDEENTGEQHLYVINVQPNNGSVQPEPKCLTCKAMQLLSTAKQHFENCTHFSAYFNPRNISDTNSKGKYVLQCNGPGLPVAGIFYGRYNNFLRVIYSIRKIYAESMRQYAIPTNVYSSVPLSGGHSARVKLILPPSWRQELRDAAFPVIIQLNGKPNSQSVSTKWKTHWGTYMSSQKGVVYVELDVRGSKGQSTNEFFGNIGDIEIKDKIDVIITLLKTHKYLDKTRIGIWGWEYGGYVTTMLMGTQEKIFKCGIAVAPIADWDYYNSAFTERVLGLKGESDNGRYVNADVRKKVRSIASDSLYIIQGLADISVPYQHGITLAKALAENRIIFRHQIYANEGHKLSGVLPHAYSSMEDYFTQCLKLEEDDDLSNQLDFDSSKSRL